MEQQKKEENAWIFGSGKREKLSGARAVQKKRHVKQPGTRGLPPLKGLLPSGTLLSAKYKGQTYEAQVTLDGKISYGEKTFNSPSAAAIFITDGPKDGWIFWKYKDQKGNWVLIDELRHRQAQVELQK